MTSEITMIEDHKTKTNLANEIEQRIEDENKAIESSQWEKIGETGVDSGQLVIIDPCHIMGEKEYDTMIANRFQGNRCDPTQYKDGVILNTANGDGTYEVFAKKAKDGSIYELKISLCNTPQKEKEFCEFITKHTRELDANKLKVLELTQ